MPPNIDAKNLYDIVESLIKKNSAAYGFTYRLNTFGISDSLSEAIKFTIYRIVQEIMHNVVKHASANHVSVSITQTDDGINLMVEDDGKGFDKDLAEMGLGLKNIHSRVKLLNGYFDVDSAISRGTIFNITIPLK
jgi:signal transduction histidine kinase